MGARRRANAERVGTLARTRDPEERDGVPREAAEPLGERQRGAESPQPGPGRAARERPRRAPAGQRARADRPARRVGRREAGEPPSCF